MSTTFHDVVKKQIIQEAYDKAYEKTGVAKAIIRSRSRTGPVARARHIFCAVCYSRGMTYMDIGKEIDRDHTSVVNSIKWIRANVPSLAKALAKRMPLQEDSQLAQKVAKELYEEAVTKVKAEYEDKINSMARYAVVKELTLTEMLRRAGRQAIGPCSAASQECMVAFVRYQGKRYEVSFVKDYTGQDYVWKCVGIEWSI